MAWLSATLRQPAPSPFLQLLWLGTPLPNFPMRAPAADAFTEVLLHSLHCWVLLLPLYREPLCTARDLTERHVSAASPVACLASALA
ncbi:hypothetical protein DRB96_35420 [Streptomyces sp. ICC1]|nr:hypothetical protein DRB89_33240 [Streptomyces sp. ICC4]AWZ16611.1 hypothetical protein DRB96_35420 [Streptomyces sp. ICC1]